MEEIEPIHRSPSDARGQGTQVPQSDPTFRQLQPPNVSPVTPSITPPTHKAPERARSVKAMDAKRMTALVSAAVQSNNTTSSSPYLVDPISLQPKLIEGYTGDPERVCLFLKFLAAKMEVCPHDNTKLLTTWGTPTQASISDQLLWYAQTHGSTKLAKVKSWGKTINALFRIFAHIVWPNRSKYVQIKRRCVYGLRFKDDIGCRPSNTLLSPLPTTYCVT